MKNLDILIIDYIFHLNELKIKTTHCSFLIYLIVDVTCQQRFDNVNIVDNVSIIVVDQSQTFTFSHGISTPDDMRCLQKVLIGSKWCLEGNKNWKQKVSRNALNVVGGEGTKNTHQITEEVFVNLMRKHSIHWFFLRLFSYTL